MDAQVLYLDEDSLWLDDPLELEWHFEEMQRRGAIWGLAEEAAAGPNWYTKGGRRRHLHCGNSSSGCAELMFTGQQQWWPDQEDHLGADAPLGMPCRCGPPLLWGEGPQLRRDAG